MFIRIISSTVAIALLVSANAQASLLVSPTAGTLGVNRFFSSSTAALNAAAISTLVGYNPATFGTLQLLYGNNVGGSEEGPFAGNYSTVYMPPSDPKGFKTTWDGGAFINYSKVYLVVKDGVAGQYVFDISPATPGLATPNFWDGKMDIIGSDFFPTQGAISHVRIWGAGVRDIVIPEPGTLAIWALGLGIAFGVTRRRVRA